jgi:aspartate carbamoyltransferase catalytic subunit
MEYKEYSRMVKRASECYEQAQQRKAEKRLQAMHPSPELTKIQGKVLNKKIKPQYQGFAVIKAVIKKPDHLGITDK